MKVLVAPSSGNKNPYQSLLISSLKSSGAEVILPKGFFLPWVSMLENGFPQIIHLQWQHIYFTGKGLPGSILRTTLFFLQMLILRMVGVRSVWTVHNLTSHEKRNANWEIGACRLLARVVDRIIVHCESVRPTVGRTYRVPEKKIHVVPHGHYVDWYPPPLNRDEARSMLGLGKANRIFLFFGQVRQYKGLDQLLETFSSVHDDDVRLVLAGEPRPPSLATSLKEKATLDPRVVTEFKFIDDIRLVTYLCACDLVILPYRDSLTSGAAVLAASFSRPVLMPRLGCMQEFPAEGAIFYEPNQPNSLHSALDRALSAPLAEMGTIGRSYIETFPWSLVGTRTLEVYSSIL